MLEKSLTTCGMSFGKPFPSKTGGLLPSKSLICITFHTDTIIPHMSRNTQYKPNYFPLHWDMTVLILNRNSSIQKYIARWQSFKYYTPVPSDTCIQKFIQKHSSAIWHRCVLTIEKLVQEIRNVHGLAHLMLEVLQSLGGFQ